MSTAQPRLGIHKIGDTVVSDSDLSFLKLALDLAAKGRFGVSPNPMVGAVVTQGSRIVGQGYHHQVGGPHAEIEAFRDAGESTQGGTLYVTLEPCNHQGRTPPCSDATIAAGIRRVVACHRDPNPKVAGMGFEKLRQAGIAVEFGFLVEEAVELNWQFLTPWIRERPAVTLKWAMSLDGKIATSAGESQWISGPDGRQWGLEQREDHDAILVGSGTALADNPRLNRRLGLAQGSNTRVILDRRLRLQPDARLFDVEGPILVYALPDVDPGRLRGLESRGATVALLERVEPATVLADLHQRGIGSVLIEGGGEIHGSFAASIAFDRVAVCCAPMLIGGIGASGPVGGSGIPRLTDAPHVDKLRVEARGSDLILTGFEVTCLQVLFESVAG